MPVRLRTGRLVLELQGSPALSVERALSIGLHHQDDETNRLAWRGVR
jgi:hypothetical protein